MTRHRADRTAQVCDRTIAAIAEKRQVTASNS
jgi:hypothetical protein